MVANHSYTPAYTKKRDDGCCSANFLKYLLFIYNFVFLIAGIGVLAVGVWTILSRHDYVSLLSSNTYVSIAYILVLAGGVVMIATMVGCVGVWKEERRALLIYVFLLLLILLMELTAGIMAYVYQEQVETELESNLQETFKIYYHYDNIRTADINKLQHEHHCCGAAGFEDWQMSRWKRENSRLENAVPDTCCRSESFGCGKRDHPSNIYQDGCMKPLELVVKEQLIILGAVGLGVSTIQVFGMILSLCLYLRLRDEYD